MCVVETKKPGSIRRMQCQGIIQAMWALAGFRNTLEFKLQPVSLLEMMGAPVVAQKILQHVILCCTTNHILT